MPRRTVAWLAIAALCSGCVAYVPMRGGTPPLQRGTVVRATLSSPAEVPLTNVTARSVQVVDGEVVESNGDELVLSALWLRSTNGVEHKGIGETVSVSWQGLAQVEVRRISAVRTGLLAGVLALVAILANAALSGGGGEEPPPPPPPPL